MKYGACLNKTCSFTHIKNTVRGNNFNSQLKCNNFLKSSITSQKCSNQNIPKPNSSTSLPQNFINKVRASWTRDKKFTPQSNLLQSCKIGNETPKSDVKKNVSLVTNKYVGLERKNFHPDPNFQPYTYWNFVGGKYRRILKFS